jgi:DNA-directed RNA polymerase specialized sigma24 family protein
MLDDLPDYSADSDWMLQSSQVSDVALVCELVKTYCPLLSRLAVLLLIDPEKARLVARQVVTWAVVNRHRFWGSTSLRIWLFNHAYQVCKRFNRIRRLPWRFGGKERPPWVALLVQKQPAGSQDLRLAQIFARLGEKERHLLALESLQELTPQEIAQVMCGKERAGPFQPGAPGASASVLKLMRQSPLSQAEIKSRLKQLLQDILPLHELSPAEQSTLCAEIEAEIAIDRRQKKFAIGGKELAAGALVVALVIGLGLAADLMAPFSQPKLPEENLAATMAADHNVFVTPPASAFGVFFSSTDFPSNELLTPTPLTPLPPVKPLSMQSSLQEIKDRMGQSSQHWNTLFAEALVVDYGPVGYIGPPQLYRNRLWFSQPGHRLVLAGPPDSRPDYARIVIGNNYFEEDISSGVAYYPKPIDLAVSQRASTIILTYALDFANRNRLFGYYLTDMLDPYNAISEAAAMTLIRQETYPGGNVLVLRWIRANHKEQLWVDTATGLVLGWRIFVGANSEVISRDIYITRMALDINFPQGLFGYRPPFPNRAAWTDIWTPPGDILAGLSQENVGKAVDGRARIPLKPAPLGFDPSGSTLDFQWLSDPGKTEISLVSLVSGEYELAKIEMGDPWSILCTRSSDGNIIAFIDRPNIPIYTPLDVSWFRLTDPSKVYALFPDGYTGSEVAISPDSQWLAFFGCSRNETDCGVYVLNLPTQQRKKLISIGAAAYFTWSPDQQYLAMLGSDDFGSLRVFIIQMDTGNTIYTGPIDWKTFTPASDAPTRSWGVPFPSSMGGLDACVAAPHP